MIFNPFLTIKSAPPPISLYIPALLAASCPMISLRFLPKRLSWMVTQMPLIVPATSLCSGARHSTANHDTLPANPQPRVFLLNQYKEPCNTFDVAMSALRAYSVFQRPETVEIVLKCNMKYKKASYCMNEVHKLYI